MAIDVHLGDVPSSTISDASNIIFTNGIDVRKEPYADVKTDMLGSANLATKEPKIKESINEIVQDILDTGGYGIISGGVVSAQTVPNMTVQVTSCPLRTSTGARQSANANTSLAITAADITNARIDIVYVDSTGVIQYMQGTASITPVAPNTPTGGQLLAQINVSANATSITNTNITDKRKILISTDWLNTQLSELAKQSDIPNKNWCMNGGFEFWQRGVISTNPNNAVCLADRFVIGKVLTGTSPTITHSRQTLAPGEIDKAKYCYRVTTDGAGVLNSNDYAISYHSVENGTLKLCGVNKKVTVSFYARSSISNKKLGVFAQQNYGSGGTPSATENINGKYFNLTSNWQKLSATFNTNTLVGKTFGTNGDDWFRISFTYAYGNGNFSTLSGDTVAETFVGSGNIDIAQIKVESGDKATPFVPRLYGEELALCKRYYEKGDAHFISAYGTSWLTGLQFEVEKRIPPTIKLGSMADLISWASIIPTAINKTTKVISSFDYSPGTLTVGRLYKVDDYEADSEIY